MFRLISAPVCLAVLAIAATMSHAASASAATKGAFVIHNSTGNEVSYTLQWSDGDTTNITLQPGQSSAHSVPVNAFGQGVSATIMFDNDLRAGSGVTVTSYDLDVYLVNNGWDGKDYSFVTSGGGSFLNLYAS